jgi:hypothetical protein
VPGINGHALPVPDTRSHASGVAADTARIGRQGRQAVAARDAQFAKCEGVTGAWSRRNLVASGIRRDRDWANPIVRRGAVQVPGSHDRKVAEALARHRPGAPGGCNRRQPRPRDFEWA